MKKKISKEEVMEKINTKEVLKKGSKTIEDFKKFIARGNVIDLAVGVIVGSAFGKIVSSIVDDILMPILGAIIGGIDFTNLSVTIGDAVITYGNFIQNVIDFLIIAVCIFFIVKIFEKFERKEEAKEVVVEPKKDEQIVLLEEIRDLLKNKTQEQIKGM